MAFWPKWWRRSSPSRPEADSALRREAHEVTLGQDPDELSVFDDRKTTEFAVGHEAGCLGERRVGSRGDEFGRHHLFHEQHVEQLLLRARAVAESARERPAEDVAQAHESHDLRVIVVVHDREMTNPP